MELASNLEIISIQTNEIKNTSSIEMDLLDNKAKINIQILYRWMSLLSQYAF